MIQHQVHQPSLCQRSNFLSIDDDVVNSIAQMAINVQDMTTDHLKIPLLEENVSVPSSPHSPQPFQINLSTQYDPAPEPVLVEVLLQETNDVPVLSSCLTALDFRSRFFY